MNFHRANVLMTARRRFCARPTVRGDCLAKFAAGRRSHHAVAIVAELLKNDKINGKPLNFHRTNVLATARRRFCARPTVHGDRLAKFATGDETHHAVTLVAILLKI